VQDGTALGKIPGLNKATQDYVNNIKQWSNKTVEGEVIE